MAHGLCQRWIF